MWKSNVVCFFGLTVALVAAAARGDLVASGNPLPGNSWGQRFNERGVGPFDLVAVQMVSGGTFKSPTHRSFSVGGWSNGLEWGGASPYQATAFGPSTSNLTWAIWFDTLQSTPIVFDFVAFNGNVKLEEARASWSGSAWSIQASSSWNPTRGELTSIPLPTPMALAVVGMAAVGLAYRKRRL